MAQQRNRNDDSYQRSSQRGGQQRGYDDEHRGRGESSDFGTQYETSGMGRGREQWRESENDEGEWNRSHRGGYGGYGQGGENERGAHGQGGYGQSYGSQRGYGQSASGRGGEYGDFGGRSRGSQGSSETRRYSSAYGEGGYGSQDTAGTWGQGGFGGYSQSDVNEGGGGYGRSAYGQGASGRVQQGGMHSGQGGYGYGQTAGYGAGRGMHESGAGSAQQRRNARGPKGYKRSDERIKEEVCERLWSMDIDASEVTLEVSDGKVKLEGTVPERWMKHSIEDIADECWGVQDVDNRIRVQGSSADHTSATQSNASGAQSGSSGSGAAGRSKEK